MALAFAMPYAFAEPVNAQKLGHTLEASIPKVSEFAAIRAEAEKRSLRVWALGGAAASIAEHGKQNLLNKLPEVPTPRYAWRLDNILLPEQDIDLVISRRDGAAESAKEVDEFLAWVREHYPLTTDGKSRWDAIGLRTPIPDRRKMALEGNPDFLLQHNDSLSLGMLEITEPSKGESVVKNLKGGSDLLADAAADRFHYFFSAAHEATARFKDGTNPPILSVVRALEKALRYRKELDPESLPQILKIIQESKPESVKPGTYVHNYLAGRGHRLITHAANPGEAFELLSALGLDKKLMALPGSDKNRAGSLAWWLNKKPLPATPDASLVPTGKTAKDLDIPYVTHWTTHANHRLLTWNYDGTPRLFESRKGVTGEGAVITDGFYTYRKSERSAVYPPRFSEASVLFSVRPEAREGVDFVIRENAVVWKNFSSLEAVGDSTEYPRNLHCNQLYANVGGTLIPYPRSKYDWLKAPAGLAAAVAVGYAGWKAVDIFEARKRQREEEEERAWRERVAEDRRQSRLEQERRAALEKESREAARNRFLKELAAADSEGGKSFRCLQVLSSGDPNPDEPDCHEADSRYAARAAAWLLDSGVGEKEIPTAGLVAKVRKIDTQAGLSCVELGLKMPSRSFTLEELAESCQGDPPLLAGGIANSTLKIFAKYEGSTRGEALRKALRLHADDFAACHEMLGSELSYKGSWLQDCAEMTGHQRKILKSLMMKVPSYPQDISAIRQLESLHADCFINTQATGVSWENALASCGPDAPPFLRSAAGEWAKARLRDGVRVKNTFRRLSEIKNTTQAQCLSAIAADGREFPDDPVFDACAKLAEGETAGLPLLKGAMLYSSSKQDITSAKILSLMRAAPSTSACLHLLERHKYLSFDGNRIRQCEGDWSQENLLLLDKVMGEYPPARGLAIKEFGDILKAGPERRACIQSLMDNGKNLLYPDNWKRCNAKP